MLILGINAYHGDVAAALLRDGELVAAVEKKRFRRIKHYAGFPRDAIRGVPQHRWHRRTRTSTRSRCHAIQLLICGARVCLHYATSRARRLSAIVPQMRCPFATSPRYTATELGLDESACHARMHYVEHHAAHLASSYFASPFDDAAVVCD
jgi:carbamoyltransferase